MRYYFRIACQPQRYDCGLTCRTQPQLSYVLKSVKEYTASTLIIPGPFRLLSFGRFSVSNTFPTPTGPTFLSFVTFVRPRRVSVKPSTSRWVGFHLLIVLDIALVFGSVYWDRTNLLRLTAGHTHHEYQDGIKLSASLSHSLSPAYQGLNVVQGVLWHRRRESNPPRSDRQSDITIRWTLRYNLVA